MKISSEKVLDRKFRTLSRQTLFENVLKEREKKVRRKKKTEVEKEDCNVRRTTSKNC